MKSLIKRFVKDESGATAIEYGLIAAGLAVTVVALFSGNTSVVRTTLTGIFTEVQTAATTMNQQLCELTLKAEGYEITPPFE